MTPESRKIFNTYTGVLLIVFALVCYGMGVYMITVPAAEKPAPLPTVATINKQPCLDGIAALGLTASSNGADIQVKDKNSDLSPLDRLKTASLGISMCHLYLKSFCMGPACPDSSAISFTLSPEEPEAALP